MDYLPHTDQGLLEWTITLLKYLMSRLTKFNYPKDDYDLLEQEKNVYAQKLEVSRESATRTPMNIEGKNVAKKVLEKHIRKSVGEYLIRNHLLTEEDLKLLGLPIHKTTRSPVPPPTALVELKLRQLPGFRVEVNFAPESVDAAEKEHREAKPYGVRGVEIRWAILPAPPKSLDDLVHSEFDTRTPYIFQFDLPESGKKLYLCARWENTTGQKGPWNEIHSVTIP
jgi:hypothetical protein